MNNDDKARAENKMILSRFAPWPACYWWVVRAGVAGPAVVAIVVPVQSPLYHLPAGLVAMRCWAEIARWRDSPASPRTIHCI